MNTPFTIQLNVEQSNYNDDIPILDQQTYAVRVTLRHFIRDVYNSIWYNSHQFNLKPIFLKIVDSNGVSVPDITFHELLNTEEPPSSPVTDYTLRIDYTLFNNPSIPTRDPIEELFDVMIEWGDSDGSTHTIRIRESLACTVGTLKDYVAEERNKTITDGEFVDGSYFNLRYWSEDDAAEDDRCLGDVVGLDVLPLTPALFDLSYNLERITGDGEQRETEEQRDNDADSSSRFFVKVRSDVRNLQEESSLFELNGETTLRDFINSIIERADAYQVRRTFFNQVKLTYQGTLISESNFDDKLYQLLHLTPEILTTNRNILVMDLSIHQHLSGVEGGMLSRQFLNDLRSNTRFDFLPTTGDDLLHEQEPEDSEPGEMARMDPTRIVLASGEEWALTGDSFDVLETNAMSVGPSQPPSRLVVNQDDLFQQVYEISMVLPGDTDPSVVILNTNQCIIVDNKVDAPYLLLNESGLAKLSGTFKDENGTLLQQVQINLYDPIPAPTPTRNEQGNVPQNDGTREMRQPETNVAGNAAGANVHAAVRQQGPFARLPGFMILSFLFRGMRFAFNYIRNYAGTLFQVVFVIVLFDFWSLPIVVWRNTMFVVLCYLLVFESRMVANIISQRLLTDRNAERFNGSVWNLLTSIKQRLRSWNDSRDQFIIQTQVRLVKFGVNKPRDYTYMVIDPNRRRVELLKHSFRNLARDLVIFVITIIPSIMPLLEIELSEYRDTETADLKADIRCLYDSFVRAKREYLHKTGNVFPHDFNIRLVNEYRRPEPEPEQQLGQQEQPGEVPAGDPPAGSGAYSENEIEYQVMLMQYLTLNRIYNQCIQSL